LSKWNATNVILTKFKLFEIIIDSNEDEKLYLLIKAIVIQRPISIEIIPLGDLFNGILTDIHMKLLEGIPIVGIPKNFNVTIEGFRSLLQSNQICISGCVGITGDELPLVSYSLTEIKCWGWGLNLKCTPEVRLFIDQINCYDKIQCK
jgi:hypothetical protein